MSPLLKGMAGTQKPLFGGNFGLFGRKHRDTSAAWRRR